MTKSNLGTTGDLTPKMRKTGNVLALSIAAYREGDVNTAFDLFIEGMEGHLRGNELADVSPDFAALIEQALSEASSMYDGTPLVLVETEKADDDEGLLTADDELSDDDDDSYMGEGDEARVLDDDAVNANLASL